jgi:hypothetical protein
MIVSSLPVSCQISSQTIMSETENSDSRSESSLSLSDSQVILIEHIEDYQIPCQKRMSIDLFVSRLHTGCRSCREGSAASRRESEKSGARTYSTSRPTCSSASTPSPSECDSHQKSSPLLLSHGTDRACSNDSSTWTRTG